MKSDSSSEWDDFYASRKIWPVLAASVGYLLLSYFLIGYKIDQICLVAFFNLFFFLSPVTRKLIKGLLIFIIFWIIFDYMKAFPNYQFREVHIESLYRAEKSIFGIRVDNTHWLTPNEYWQIHSTTFLDILTGICYMSWVPVPLAFSIFLFFRNRNAFLQFSLTFLLVNLIGFVIYYLYPASPPWYVQQHGFQFVSHTAGNTGGLERFDHFFGLDIFKTVYGKSSNVFAAMPSLHAAYPVIVVYYGIKNKIGWMNWVFAVLMTGIWFSAIYTGHHYILDVLAGIFCAITGILLFQWMIEKNRWLGRFINSLAMKLL